MAKNNWQTLQNGRKNEVVLSIFFSELPEIYVASLLQEVNERDTERSGMFYKCRLFHMKETSRVWSISPLK